MKLKTILLTAVIVLLVVVLALLVTRDRPQAGPGVKARIKQYKVIKEEQQLITDILPLRYEAAVIQAKFKPTPQKIQPVPPLNIPPIKE